MFYKYFCFCYCSMGNLWKNPTKLELLVQLAAGRNIHKRRKIATAIHINTQKTILDYLD